MNDLVDDPEVLYDDLGDVFEINLGHDLGNDFWDDFYGRI